MVFEVIRAINRGSLRGQPVVGDCSPNKNSFSDLSFIKRLKSHKKNHNFHFYLKLVRMLDKKDFEVLFRNEFRRMTLFAMRYVKDFDTAREIVQESFLGLWEKRTTINPEREVKSYLSTSVRNRSLNYLRDHNKFDRELIALEGLSHDAATEANPDIELSELRDRIDNAVDELPEKCREVFLFNRNEHMKYQEIAELLGISVKTVEAQMSKALAHLRQRLKEYLTILILFLLNA